MHVMLYGEDIGVELVELVDLVVYRTTHYRSTDTSVAKEQCKCLFDNCVYS